MWHWLITVWNLMFVNPQFNNNRSPNHKLSGCALCRCTISYWMICCVMILQMGTNRSISIAIGDRIGQIMPPMQNIVIRKSLEFVDVSILNYLKILQELVEKTHKRSLLSSFIFVCESPFWFWTLVNNLKSCYSRA